MNGKLVGGAIVLTGAIAGLAMYWLQVHAFYEPVAADAPQARMQIYEGAEPLIAPPWFDCFDAARIGPDVADGPAVAFLSQREIAPGVDRVIAVYPDGRAFAWHQLNEKYAEQ